jgi:G patch domain/KOW motif-containing protein
MQYDVASEPYIGRDIEIEAYDRMPIEAFGKSVLAKLGWKEGKAIGRTNMLQGSNAKIVQPIEYIPRQHRLGLGAKPLSLE